MFLLDKYSTCMFALFGCCCRRRARMANESVLLASYSTPSRHRPRQLKPRRHRRRTQTPRRQQATQSRPQRKIHRRRRRRAPRRRRPRRPRCPRRRPTWTTPRVKSKYPTVTASLAGWPPAVCRSTYPTPTRTRDSIRPSTSKRAIGRAASSACPYSTRRASVWLSPRRSTRSTTTTTKIANNNNNNKNSNNRQPATALRHPPFSPRKTKKCVCCSL